MRGKCLSLFAKTLTSLCRETASLFPQCSYRAGVWKAEKTKDTGRRSYAGLQNTNDAHHHQNSTR